MVALALRLFRLGDWSFWGDEYFTITGREDGFNYTLLRRSLASDLIQFTVRLFGPSEWAARLVPALVGALTVLALYFLLKPITSKRVSLLAALLLAISPWHLYWSQNARFYTLLLLFCTLSVICFYRGLEEDRPVLLVLAVLFLGLATRERLVALLLIPVYGLYPLLIWVFRFDRPPGLRWNRLSLFFLPLVLGAAAFVMPYALDLSQWMVNFGPPANSPQRILAGVVFYLTVPLAGLAAFGGARLVLRKSRQGLFFALVASVPVLLMMVISLLHYAANRYAFVSLAGWVVLAALAVQEISAQNHGTRKMLVAGVVALLVISSLFDIGFYFFGRNGNRQDWKAALHYIRENVQPGDAVVVNDVELSEYYLGNRPSHYGAVDWHEPLPRRVWFVEEEGAWKSYPNEMGWVQQHARLMAVFDVEIPARTFPMRVYLYTRELIPGRSP